MPCRNGHIMLDDVSLVAAWHTRHWISTGTRYTATQRLWNLTQATTVIRTTLNWQSNSCEKQWVVNPRISFLFHSWKLHFALAKRYTISPLYIVFFGVFPICGRQLGFHHPHSSVLLFFSLYSCLFYLFCLAELSHFSFGLPIFRCSHFHVLFTTSSSAFFLSP